MGNTLNKGQFSLLSLSLKIQVIQEYGQLLKIIKMNKLDLHIYALYDFHIAHYLITPAKITDRVEILTSRELVNFLMQDST